MINKLFVFSVCLSKVILRGGNTKYVFVSLDDSLIFQQTDVEITFLQVQLRSILYLHCIAED